MITERFVRTLSCSTLDSSNLLTLRTKAEFMFFSLIADLQVYQRHVTYVGMSTKPCQTVHDGGTRHLIEDRQEDRNGHLSMDFGTPISREAAIRDLRAVTMHTKLLFSPPNYYI